MISGGMTAIEQRELLKEEREFQEQQENKRREQMLEDERRREEEARAERERLAAEEMKRLGEINAAEEAVIAEAKAAETKDTKSSMSKVSFYEALGKGVVNKPTTVEKPK